LPEHFPAIFGPSADEPLDAAAVTDRFVELAAEIGRAPEEVADGFLKVAVENMANAIKKISVARGYDITRYALACFGGAGGQHACAIADRLGMETVHIHPLSGVLSAYGMGLAEIRANRSKAVVLDLTEKSELALQETAARLETEARAELEQQGIGAADTCIMVALHIRYSGTDTPIPVTPRELTWMLGEPGWIPGARHAFEAAHSVAGRASFIGQAAGSGCSGSGGHEAAAGPDRTNRNCRSASAMLLRPARPAFLHGSMAGRRRPSARRAASRPVAGGPSIDHRSRIRRSWSSGLAGR
jgi:5-oxoprolinase (ATP-hydrolysing)